MIETLIIPSWCGDYSLTADGEAKCVLTVKDPTVSEQISLERFLLKCFSKGWVKPFAGIAGNGETKIEILASILDASKLLLGRKSPRTGIITAVKSVNGEVEAVLGETPKLEEALAKPEAKEAVTTRRPTLCCPVPVAGPDIRASRVLELFSTAQQRRDWQEHGYLRCHGCFSGHRYRVAHRHSALAREQRKIVWDETDDRVIHAYDWSLPPAEEALAVKHAIEFAEHWIRNSSSCLYAGATDRYEDPFVDGGDREGLDGTKDAAFVRSFGDGLRTGLGLLMKITKG
jgi:hypothetical protein